MDNLKLPAIADHPEERREQVRDRSEMAGAKGGDSMDGNLLVHLKGSKGAMLLSEDGDHNVPFLEFASQAQGLVLVPARTGVKLPQ